MLNGNFPQYIYINTHPSIPPYPSRPSLPSSSSSTIWFSFPFLLLHRPLHHLHSRTLTIIKLLTPSPNRCSPSSFPFSSSSFLLFSATTGGHDAGQTWSNHRALLPFLSPSRHYSFVQPLKTTAKPFSGDDGLRRVMPSRIQAQVIPFFLSFLVFCLIWVRFERAWFRFLGFWVR